MPYLKYIFITGLVLFMPFVLFSQRPADAISITTDRNSINKSDIDFISNNSDFCDYYVVLDFPELIGYSSKSTIPCKKTVSPRSQNIMALRMDNHATTSPTFRYKYTFYRGNINPKLNLDYIYALPIKSGDSTRVRMLQGKDLELVFSFKHTNDTVYACRSGRICDNSLTDYTSRFNRTKERIIVYHDDKSFSEYSNHSKSLVFPGEDIKIGQPIAIMSPNEKGSKFLNFSVSYLDKNKIEDEESGNKHSGIMPVFHTQNKGDLKIEENTTYIKEVTEDMITQEMSKKERAKYEKDKSKQK